MADAQRIQRTVDHVRDAEWTAQQLRHPRLLTAALTWRLSTSPTWIRSLCPNAPGRVGVDAAGESVDDALNALEAWNAVAAASVDAAGSRQARRLLGRVLCASAHDSSEVEEDLARCIAVQTFAMVKARADAGSTRWNSGPSPGSVVWAREDLASLKARR